MAAVRSAPLSPEEVGIAIADVVENPGGPFRVPVGASALALLGAERKTPVDGRFDIAAMAAGR